MLVKAGSVLVVPRQGLRDEDVTSTLADNGQLNLAAESVAHKAAKSKGKGKGQHASGGQKSASSQEAPKVAAKTNAKPNSTSKSDGKQALTTRKVAAQ